MFSFGNTGSDTSSIKQFAKHTHNGPEISSSKSPWNLKQKTFYKFWKIHFHRNFIH